MFRQCMFFITVSLQNGFPFIWPMLCPQESLWPHFTLIIFSIFPFWIVAKVGLSCSPESLTLKSKFYGDPVDQSGEKEHDMFVIWSQTVANKTAAVTVSRSSIARWYTLKQTNFHPGHILWITCRLNVYNQGNRSCTRYDVTMHLLTQGKPYESHAGWTSAIKARALAPAVAWDSCVWARLWAFFCAPFPK